MAENVTIPPDTLSSAAPVGKGLVDRLPLTRIDWAMLSGIAITVILARLIPGARTIDDAYITFRYSRNIIEGLGFVYNTGVHLLGTTTPLYTLIMALIAWISGSGDYPNYALVVNVLADVGTALLLWRLVRRMTGNRWLSALLGILWAIAPASVTFAIGGMETSLVIFFMVSAVVLFVEGDSRWTMVALGVCLTFGFLTRIDSVLWIGPLLAYQLFERVRKRQSPPWATWISAGLTVVPWLLFSFAYFGSPIANTISAKSIAYLYLPGAAAFSLLHWMATPFSEPGILGPLGSEIAFVLYVPLAVIGMLAMARKMPRLLPWLLYPWLYALVFAVANPLMFRWYFLPPMPALFFILVCGMWALIDSFQQGLQRAARRPTTRTRVAVVSRLIYGLIGILWIVSSLSAWTLRLDHGSDHPAPQMAWTKMELNYEYFADELRTKYGVTPDTVVASGDIGAVGYFSRATIIDTVGLVTPNVSRYYPLAASMFAPDENYAVPAQLILDAKPKYFITMEGYIHTSLLNNPAFQAEYKLIDFIPTDYFGIGAQLYQRQPSP